MLNSPIITIKNISKKYNINHQQGGYVTLRDVLTNIFKNPFAFLKTKTKNILGVETKEEFWALKNINFEVMKGEIIGIIGHNGAGKSTLLKILSQITPPTTGEIRIHGTVGSLLEVGTGFHPELTGRENIFLNGAILGMKKKEIIEKFNEIIKFADIEKFIDTPVKYYSSGMYVRLAFSVAAHMEPDILIIDEVLAVGDADFQQKCLGKMEDITKKEGRTIIFVSHDIRAIEKLCKNVIILKKGEMVFKGPTEKGIIEYFGNKYNQLKSVFVNEIDINKKVIFTKIEIKNQDGISTAELKYSEKIKIDIDYIVSEDIQDVLLCIFIIKNGKYFAISSEVDQENQKNNSLREYKKGKYQSQITLPAYSLPEGYYNIEISIQKPFEYYVERFTGILIHTNSSTKAPNKLWSEVPVESPLILEYKTKKND